MSLSLSKLSNFQLDGNIHFDLFLSAAEGDGRGKIFLEPGTFAIAETWQVFSDLRAECDDEFDEPIFENNLSRRLEEFLFAITGEETNILVDISSMTHTMMASIVRCPYQTNSDLRIKFHFVYSIAAYAPPPEILPPNEDIRPVDSFFAGWPSDATGQTSLVLGLGYEKEKAEGACEYFDAKETWVFFPKSPVAQYEEVVYQNNASLIDRVRRSNRYVEYQVANPSSIFGQLIEIVLHNSESNPILLPFGPKVFFLLSLIVASVYSRVGVWHVTGDMELTQTDQQDSGNTVGFCVEFAPG